MYLEDRDGTSFISAGDDKFLAITYTPKPGETEQAVLNHAKDVEKYLKQKKHVKTIQYSVGGSSPVDPTGSTEIVWQSWLNMIMTRLILM